MQFQFLFADSKPDPNVCNVSLITHGHISKLQILSPEFKCTNTLQYIPEMYYILPHSCVTNNIQEGSQYNSNLHIHASWKWRCYLLKIQEPATTDPQQIWTLEWHHDHLKKRQKRKNCDKRLCETSPDVNAQEKPWLCLN
jgi:hypothetical protein